MPNGDSAPDVQKILDDENFKGLPLPEKDKVLSKMDSNYAGLPGRERAKALGVIHYGKDEMEKPQESTLLRSIYGIGRGLNDVVEGIYQTIFHPINTAEPIVSGTEEHVKKAQQEPTTTGNLAENGRAVPTCDPVG